MGAYRRGPAIGTICRIPVCASSTTSCCGWPISQPRGASAV